APCSVRFRLDRELDRRAHVAADVDDDREGAELLERLLEVDPAPVDGDALLGEQPLDVEVRDRAEEPAVLARACLHEELESRDACRHRVRSLLLALGLRTDHPLLVLEDAQVLPARLDGEPAREEVVAGVPRLHAHHLADLPEMWDVVAENDLDCHGSAPHGYAVVYGKSATVRARLMAGVS